VLPSLDPASEAVDDDCELGRRGNMGLRLLAEVVATNFLDVCAVFFSDFAAGGGGGCGCLSDTAVLPDEAAPSSPESGGDTNRAVGRGPDDEGPLVFFRIGCKGGGLDEEDVGSFVACFGGEPLSRAFPRPPWASLGGSSEPDIILSSSCWLSLGI